MAMFNSYMFNNQRVKKKRTDDIRVHVGDRMRWGILYNWLLTPQQITNWDSSWVNYQVFADAAGENQVEKGVLLDCMMKN